MEKQSFLKEISVITKNLLRICSQVRITDQDQLELLKSLKNLQEEVLLCNNRRILEEVEKKEGEK